METYNDLVNFLPHIQAKIERDLVVAAAPGVQFATRRSDPFSQSRLDIHMDVFQRLVPSEFSGSNFAFDFAQSTGNQFEFIGS
jgi:hypothetical protein